MSSDYFWIFVRSSALAAFIVAIGIIVAAFQRVHSQFEQVEYALNINGMAFLESVQNEDFIQFHKTLGSVMSLDVSRVFFEGKEDQERIFKFVEVNRTQLGSWLKIERKFNLKSLGVNLGGIHASIYGSTVLYNLLRDQWLAILFFLFSILLVSSISNFKILSAVRKATRDIESYSSIDYLPPFLADPLKRLFEVQVKNMRLEHEANYVRLAKQVAHDIRSPLTALNVVIKSASELDEVNRQTLNRLSVRISKIADDLLNRAKSKCLHENMVRVERSGKIVNSSFLGFGINKKSPVLMSSLLSELVEEKKLEYADRTCLKFAPLTVMNGQDVECAIDSSQFKRILSNLINNSVEAIEESGSISVVGELIDDEFLIEVRDTGVGVPDYLIEKVFEEGISFKKKKGSGLGLHHAKQVLETWGGSIAIKSRIKRGTTVNIKLPALV